MALPLGEDDPLERFARVHQTMDALKGSPQALGASAAVGATGLVSAAAFEAHDARWATSSATRTW